jgi:acyl transferase domain-containing protein
MRHTSTEPIAIIGMGCRLPGAPDLRAFWRLLTEGREAIREVPPERWKADVFFDPRPATPGKMITRRFGLVDDIERFDAYFFGIPPRQAVRTDPQQRMLLEAAWEAMENAGLAAEQLAGSSCGVFIGICSDEYLTLQMTDHANLDIYAGMGGNRGAPPGRLAYFFNLNGPTMSVDTACSSSLVAIHNAVNNLRAGHCAMAFAGGSNAIVHPMTAIAFSQAGMLSPDGRCKAFDERANGFVRAEGAGMVLLKPLARALADGDPVWAVIRGTAVSNDGPTSPMMTPSRIGQEIALRAAYEDAGVSPSLVDYVEAHGTGTAVGDPIEMEALDAVVGEGRGPDRTCMVGSAKTNVGHLEGGAGVVGLIKTALCLKHRQIPPSLHFETPNPKIPWDRLPFQVPTDLRPWPDTIGRRAFAGVNSFGISGTNAHTVLEEAPQEIAASPAAERSAELLALSAQTEESLRETARAYQDFLAAEPASLRDLCYSAGARRTHHDYRAALVARTREELAEQLAACASGELSGGVLSGVKGHERPRPVFVFSGIGTQWPQMGRALCRQEPVFRETMERCDAVFRELAGWSVLEEIGGPRLDEVEVMQPAIFSVQVALAALWRSWGVEPAAVVGHSLGEMAAAHVAGALTLEDAARVVRMRSLLMQRVNGKGRMAAVELDAEQACAAINGLQDRVDVAVLNSPTSTVLSGDPEALDQIVGQLDRRGVFSRFLRSQVAFHSRQVEPFMGELQESLAGLRPGAASIPVYSTVTGTPSDGSGLDAAYWARNMRQSVMFAPAVAALLDAGYDTFLEISPHPVLAVPIRQTALQTGRRTTLLSSLRRAEDECSALLESLGALYAAGHDVDWGGLFPGGGRFIPPPTYRWQRERHWFEEEGKQGTACELLRARFGGRGQDGASSHPMLLRHWHSADRPGKHAWEVELDLRHYPYLSDHRMQSVPLVPAAVYVEMALAASLEAFGSGPRTVRDVELLKPVFLPDNDPRRLQLVMDREESSASFTVYGRDSAQGGWTAHVTGKIAFTADPLQPDVEMDFSRADPGIGWEREMSGETFYDNAEHRSLDYGPAFRGIERAWNRAGHALAEIRVPESAVRGPYQFHPILLDLYFQVYLAGKVRRQGRSALPVGIGGLQILRAPEPGERLWGRARIVEEENDALCDLIVFDDAGQVVALETGHHVRFLEPKTDPTSNWLYEQRWAESPRTGPAPEVRGAWLILGDRGGVGEHLCSTLRAHGEDCVLIPPDLVPSSREGMLDAARGVTSGASPWRGAVHLCALDAPGNSEICPESLPASQRTVCASALALVQAATALEASPRIWFVTRGAQSVTDGESPAIAQAPLIGMVRVAAAEHPPLSATLVDLDGAGGGADALFEELWHADREQEVALRGEARYASRLARLAPAEAHCRPVRAGESFYLDTAGDGILDHLTLQAAERRPPGPGEVEIEVAAVGLNFLDVLRSLNLAPGLPGGPAWFGMECSGTVAAVGAEVEHVAVGDEVIAMHSGAPGCFSRFLTTRAGRVFRKPAHLSLEEAATIPVAYQTAYYALHHLGRMTAGESALIHCAAGGVGLAAVRLAQAAGVEVFATAGTPEKREYLKSLGVRYVMNSRTLDFAREVMEYTGGRGVDLVLNSLAGEAIPRSLSVLATGGRFLEIGKRDIYADTRLGLLPFQRNLSFHAIDLLRMGIERPELAQRLGAEVAQHIAGGRFAPLPYRAFPVSEAAEAFRHMAEGKHLGKVVITLRESNVVVRENVQPVQIRPDATYLITGGMGALGLAFARDLASRGARHIALIGRRRPGEDALQAISEIRDTASVEIFPCDVSKPAELDSVLARIENTMPPIRGVIHAAGILDDGILQQLEWPRFEAVLAPKVQGTWNLHTRFARTALDFFVLFSSAAATFGAPGQGNYAAGNAFLDSLARFRAAAGLPVLAVAWAAWGEIGMAASETATRRMEAQGRQPIPVKDGLAVLHKLLARPVSQVTVAPIDWARQGAANPVLGDLPFLSSLAGEIRSSAPAAAAGAGNTVAAEVLAAPDDATRRSLLLDYVRQQVSRVLRIAEGRLDPHAGLTRLGLDSLMAVELKNRMEGGLGCSIPVVKLLAGASAADLAALFDAELPKASAAMA